ncbi:MAG: hypothetical protein ACD_30C00005G0005 [uncultured bacterium]|uniref:Uncharacterized protein n=4 Tax=Candidatus Daviesiibacteriota TaxID=1752718 RepID=A0A0G0F1I2_9BACT|nr:MAG: hypothetical protein ACD_30C00005G0005 [uncultured bacterium]KKQ07500.1 MAG: hypothetical protein US19_C0044G0017 [Candidatus Daviesbacteria bacterium GW2011_GWB1_36_5]KKQ15136.1 MAG: hypothetical protein US28_C0022G0008 [Candidatus Daviesbacteria bacterium GW2011_GWA1_36_8]OGE16627.1 MAG: hypothetical protein A2858_02160 [Candidatus Daviesbacteria bacterium RIFCSPHIGHO2_01_FULL_36_37]OGE33365.1 MAG: hypothetical protein A3C99_01590 [Candidatus Daviesbacteria bacterium RIFCSPHIGHO2_02_F
MNLFKSKRPHYEHLRKKWISRNKDITENLFEKHFRNAAASTLGGLMLLSTPGLSVPITHPAQQDQSKIGASTSKNALLAAELTDKIPKETRALTPTEEKVVEELVKKDLDLDIKAEIDGKRLNRTYGVIGGEQHLYRYPGDTLEAHAKTAQDWAMYGSSGIAPGLGAWGYFTPSKAQFTPKDEAQERYYLAVQTFLSPGFSERVAEYRDFYKFRKMLVVNPKTGQAVVAVIGDAGPAEWTGKHLGGSPEVMHEVGLAGGPRKGPVLYFFLDDPQDQIPLGPVNKTEHSLAKV